jgi:hypothetical protein
MKLKVEIRNSKSETRRILTAMRANHSDKGDFKANAPQPHFHSFELRILDFGFKAA